MGLWRRKARPHLTREQALHARPLRNPQLEVMPGDGGEVSVKLPRRRTWWLNLLARIGSIPEHRLVTLDRVGTSVWNMCDGAHTVRELIAQFAREHQLSRKEAEVSMVTYLRQLAERGIIVLVIDEEKEEQQAENGKPGTDAQHP